MRFAYKLVLCAFPSVYPLCPTSTNVWLPFKPAKHINLAMVGIPQQQRERATATTTTMRNFIAKPQTLRIRNVSRTAMHCARRGKLRVVRGRVRSKAKNASSRQFDFDSIESAANANRFRLWATICPSNFDFKFVKCKRPSELATFDWNSTETSAWEFWQFGRKRNASILWILKRIWVQFENGSKFCDFS